MDQREQSPPTTNIVASFTSERSKRQMMDFRKEEYERLALEPTQTETALIIIGQQAISD
ncbi:unnamed protein product [Knipowitschia caucasica]